MSGWLRPVPLAAGGVALEPLALSHAEELYHAGNSARIWNHLPFRPSSPEEMLELVRQAAEDAEAGRRIAYAIKRNGTVLGSTSILGPSPEHRSFEIGFTWLAPSAWGTGLNGICKYLLLRYGFEDAGAARIQFRTTTGNIRSQTALRKIGAVYEGTLRKSFQGADMMFFSIVSEEWPAVRERLAPAAAAAEAESGR